jgi:CRP/FNR family cyclic AMP-dependent transcriptional regulator
MQSFSGSSRDDKIKLISTASIFSGIGLHELNMLADKCQIAHANADEIIIEQGAIGDTLYIIKKGQVSVLVKTPYKGYVRVNVLNPGDVFGEIAILRRIPRTARITTMTPCTFLTITAADFLNVYQYFPPRARDNIQIVVAKRLAQAKDAGR